MFLVEKLHYPRIFVDGEHCCWVILEPDDALPIIMGFNQYANLFSNEIADVLAASMTPLETVNIDT